MTRLPVVGGDDGNWGSLLNEYLAQSHNPDGTLKNTGLIASKYTKPASGIPRADLQGDVRASLDNADAAVSGTAPDATLTTKGILRLSGDLTGDALAPLVAPNKILGASAGANSHIQMGTITDANLHVNANISKSKLAPLAVVDADISVGAAIVQSKIQNLVSDLASKSPQVHTHAIADVTNLQTSLDGKASSAHTHDTNDITDFTSSTAAVIGNRVQAGANVTVDFNAGSGITTVSAVGGAGAVSSVVGRTGDITLTKADVGLSSVDNTSDANKPVSSLVQVALDTKINSIDVVPELYFDSSTQTWPTRTVPSGYTGWVVWDSAPYEAATAPPAAVDGDRWRRFYTA